MLITKNAKKTPQYFCDICQFTTRNKTDFERHLGRPKHIKNNTISFFDDVCTENKIHLCHCGKQYKYISGLSAHKKKCTYGQNCKQNLEPTEKELIKELLLQNQQLIFENKEFKELILDQSSKMLELATKPSTINNNNCNNKQFNLNVFLNEKCKNAMNMSDFVNSLEILDDDFEDMGKLGYVQGISNIFIKGLKDLDETARPLHCSDIKRETLYIKDNNEWNKDESKEKIIEAINGVSHKNVKYIPLWRDAHPDALDGTSKKNTQYMRIVNQVMTSITPDDTTGMNKIIRNVANSVVIDKDCLSISTVNY
jgi:hypothetical protein